MSTTATTSALDVSSEVITSTRVTFDTGEKNAEGGAILDAVVVSEDAGKKAQSDGKIAVKVKGKTETYDVVSVDSQSFVMWKANTLQGINELCDNEEEVCNMFNRGISVKQQNESRAQLLSVNKTTGEFDFAFTEAPTDLKSIISETTNRRLSPTEKILETLKNMPPEQQAAIAAALAQLRQ